MTPPLERRPSPPLWLAAAALAGSLGVGVLLVSLPPDAPDALVSEQLPAPVVTVPAEPGATTLVAGGDVMLSRYVGEQMRRHSDPTWPFLAIGQLFRDADIAFANLEAPFAWTGPVTASADTLVFKAEPEAIAGLSVAGFDVLSLANNHVLNQGAAGLRDTREMLSNATIGATGAGTNSTEAHAAVTLTRNGIRFGFLAYAFPRDGTVATDARPGIATMDVATMERDVTALAASVDVIVVSMHAGSEYTTAVTTAQRTFARAAIDAGATLVLGHHPHVVQAIEQYHDGVIAYSLGNLVFDQPWSEPTQRGLVLRATFAGAALTRVELLPVRIAQASQPQLASDTDRTIVLADAAVPRGTLDISP